MVRVHPNLGTFFAGFAVVFFLITACAAGFLAAAGFFTGAAAAAAGFFTGAVAVFILIAYMPARGVSDGTLVVAAGASQGEEHRQTGDRAAVFKALLGIASCASEVVRCPAPSHRARAVVAAGFLAAASFFAGAAAAGFFAGAACFLVALAAGTFSRSSVRRFELSLDNQKSADCCFTCRNL